MILSHYNNALEQPTQFLQDIEDFMQVVLTELDLF